VLVAVELERQAVVALVDLEHPQELLVAARRQRPH
jgi:hypothetical protein